jgi:dihydrofolate reductase
LTGVAKKKPRTGAKRAGRHAAGVKAKPKGAPKKPAGGTKKPAARASAGGRAGGSKAPRVRAYIAVSLDGYIADAGGGADWLHPYFTDEIDFGAFMRTIGVTIMGRTTFEFARKLHGRGSAPGDERASASDDPDSIGGATTVVHTRRPLDAPRAEAAPYRGDPAALVAHLKRRLAGSRKDIWHMGGGASLDAFRAAGCIDRWELAVMPVLLGAGTPLFPRHSRGLEGLRLTEHKAYRNGVVGLTYEPVE